MVVASFAWKSTGETQPLLTNKRRSNMPPKEKKDSLSTNVRWLRMYCYTGFRDCFRFHKKHHHTWRIVDYVGFIQLFLAKMLLEVCGAGGAIWGCSDIAALRNTEESKTLWRKLSLLVFGIFAIRFWWHSKHYLEHDREFPPIKLKHRRLHKLPFFQIFSAKLILEVLGAAGAIWGPSEVIGWRNEDNAFEWRIACGVVGILFAMRWMLAICTYCLCFENFEQRRPILSKLLGWSEILLVRFVLVACGACGAVWGFSEILTLRTPETDYIWRPVALSVGLLFTLRWFSQTCAYGHGLWEEDEPPPDNSSRDLIKDLEINETSLELNETDSPTAAAEFNEDT